MDGWQPIAAAAKDREGCSTGSLPSTGHEVEESVMRFPASIQYARAHNVCMDDILGMAGEGASFDSSEMQIPFVRVGRLVRIRAGEAPEHEAAAGPDGRTRTGVARRAARHDLGDRGGHDDIRQRARAIAVQRKAHARVFIDCALGLHARRFAGWAWLGIAAEQRPLEELSILCQFDPGHVRRPKSRY